MQEVALFLVSSVATRSTDSIPRQPSVLSKAEVSWHGRDESGRTCGLLTFHGAYYQVYSQKQCSVSAYGNTRRFNLSGSTALRFQPLLSSPPPPPIVPGWTPTTAAHLPGAKRWLSSNSSLDVTSCGSRSAMLDGYGEGMYGGAYAEKRSYLSGSPMHNLMHAEQELVNVDSMNEIIAQLRMKRTSSQRVGTRGDCGSRPFDEPLGVASVNVGSDTASVRARDKRCRVRPIRDARVTICVLPSAPSAPSVLIQAASSATVVQMLVARKQVPQNALSTRQRPHEKRSVPTAQHELLARPSEPARRIWRQVSDPSLSHPRADPILPLAIPSES